MSAAELRALGAEFDRRRAELQRARRQRRRQEDDRFAAEEGDTDSDGDVFVDATAAPGTPFSAPPRRAPAPAVADVNKRGVLQKWHGNLGAAAAAEQQHAAGDVWAPRFFLLRDALYFFELQRGDDDGDGDGGEGQRGYEMQPQLLRGCLPLDGCAVEVLDTTRPAQFVIVHPARPAMKLRAGNEAGARSWVASLEAAIQIANACKAAAATGTPRQRPQEGAYRHASPAAALPSADAPATSTPVSAPQDRRRW